MRLWQQWVSVLLCTGMWRHVEWWRDAIVAEQRSFAIFCPEHGGRRFFWNDGDYIPDRTVLHSKGQCLLILSNCRDACFSAFYVFGCYQSIILPCRISCQSCVSYWLMFYLPSYFGGGCGRWEFCHTSSVNVFSLWFILCSIESVTNGICNSVLISK